MNFLYLYYDIVLSPCDAMCIFDVHICWESLTPDDNVLSIQAHSASPCSFSLLFPLHPLHPLMNPICVQMFPSNLILYIYIYYSYSIYKHIIMAILIYPSWESRLCKPTKVLRMYDQSAWFDCWYFPDAQRRMVQHLRLRVAQIFQAMPAMPRCFAEIHQPMLIANFKVRCTRISFGVLSAAQRFKVVNVPRNSKTRCASEISKQRHHSHHITCQQTAPICSTCKTSQAFVNICHGWFFSV